MSILPAELNFILKYFTIKLFKRSKFGGAYAEIKNVFYFRNPINILDEDLSLGFIVDQIKIDNAGYKASK